MHGQQNIKRRSTLFPTTSQIILSLWLEMVLLSWPYALYFSFIFFQVFRFHTVSFIASLSPFEPLVSSSVRYNTISLSSAVLFQSSPPHSAFPETLAPNLLLTCTTYLLLLHILSPLPRNLPYTLPQFLFCYRSALHNLFCTDHQSKVPCNSIVMKLGVRVGAWSLDQSVC